MRLWRMGDTRSHNGLSRFENKTVIVTGSGGGIGRATAIAYAREGASLVLADIKSDENAATQKIIAALGGTAIALNVDVTQEDHAKRLMDTAVEEFGGIDVGINNAGVVSCDVKFTHEHDEKTHDNVLGVNVKGIWLCMKYQITQMLKQGAGAIVNTASSKAVVAGTPGSAFYSASKCAVVGLTRTAALEYVSSGIRINAIGPGSTMTPILERLKQEQPEYFEAGTKAAPIAYIAEPEDMASGILYMTSEEGRYIVGHTFMVDGGMSIT